GQSLSADRAVAPASLHPRQTALNTVECGTRRTKQMCALAIFVKDIAHATEGQTLDIFAVGVVAVLDQTGTGKGARLYRLLQHGIWSGSGFVEYACRPQQPDARSLQVRRSVSEFWEDHWLDPA